MLNVNANLFRIAALAQSHDETRPYLNGVFVEPHAQGVTMTATDGRYLVSIHDESGSCDKPVIVQLSKAALQACKTTQKDFEPRRLVMEINSKNAIVSSSGKDVGVSCDCIVDGVFPNWRSVVESTMIPPAGEEKAPGFDQIVLNTLCLVARELSDGYYRGLVITGALTSGAALVRFTDAPHAFGLMMPIKHETKPELPSWYSRTAFAKAA